MEHFRPSLILTLPIKLSEPERPHIEMGIMISPACDYGLKSIRALRGSQSLNYRPLESLGNIVKGLQTQMYPCNASSLV